MVKSPFDNPDKKEVLRDFFFVVSPLLCRILVESKKAFCYNNGHDFIVNDMVLP